MIKLITGLIGLATLLVFLGYYVFSLTFVPLTAVIIGVLGMAIGDFVLSLRDNGNQT
jgi:uncharacterized membrane protein